MCKKQKKQFSTNLCSIFLVLLTCLLLCTGLLACQPSGTSLPEETESTTETETPLEPLHDKDVNGTKQ